MIQNALSQSNFKYGSTAIPPKFFAQNINLRDVKRKFYHQVLLVSQKLKTLTYTVYVFMEVRAFFYL